MAEVRDWVLRVEAVDKDDALILDVRTVDLLTADSVALAYMSPVNQVRVISTVLTSVTVGAHSLALVSCSCCVCVCCCCCGCQMLEVALDEEPEDEDPEKVDHQPPVVVDDELFWPAAGRQCWQLVSTGDVQ